MGVMDVIFGTILGTGCTGIFALLVLVRSSSREAGLREDLAWLRGYREGVDDTTGDKQEAANGAITESDKNRINEAFKSFNKRFDTKLIDHNKAINAWVEDRLFKSNKTHNDRANAIIDRVDAAVEKAREDRALLVNKIEHVKNGMVLRIESMADANDRVAEIADRAIHRSASNRDRLNALASASGLRSWQALERDLEAADALAE